MRTRVTFVGVPCVRLHEQVIVLERTPHMILCCDKHQEIFKRAYER